MVILLDFLWLTKDCNLLKYNLDIIEYTVICLVSIEKKFTFLLLFLFYDVARRNKIQLSPIEEGCKLICSISKRIKFLENLCNLAAKEGE